MKTTQLGHTDIEVSQVALGTMTFGEQNTEQEAFEQLDYALSQGINFIDTAEMYPVPPKAQTYGQTETIIGRWLKSRKSRDKIVLATKVAGRADWLPWVRDGKPCLNRYHIEAAVDASLKRLQTDAIDLYQLHWPDRKTNFFGKFGYVPEPEEETVPLEETLTVLGDLVKKGKIKTVGVSNETPWGVMRLLCLAEQKGLPRVVSIQNPYNLLNRSYEVGLAEISIREKTGLLAYSPTAFGLLSGKYLEGQKGRLTLFDRFKRYSSDIATEATKAYVDLARRFDLEPIQMALAFVMQQPFVTATIIGATTMAQLKTDIDAFDLELPAALLEELEAIHQRYRIPCP